MKKISAACALAMAAALGGTALAAEDDVHLKQAAGSDLVEAVCSACHSLDYIPMNSPFLDEKGWTAEVSKMVNAYKASIDADSQKAIVAYLAANYGKPAQ
jgi:hypothetical protein